MTRYVLSMTYNDLQQTAALSLAEIPNHSRSVASPES